MLLAREPKRQGGLTFGGATAICGEEFLAIARFAQPFGRYCPETSFKIRLFQVRVGWRHPTKGLSYADVHALARVRNIDL